MASSTVKTAVSSVLLSLSIGASAQVPDILKSAAKATEPAKPQPQPSPANGAAATKEAPKLPWDPAAPTTAAAPNTKAIQPAAQPPAPSVKNSTEPAKLVPASVQTKGDTDSSKIEKIDTKMFPHKRVTPTSTVTESQQKSRSSWADQMSAAGEELALLERQAAILERQAKVDELRRKVGAPSVATKASKAHAQIEIPTPLPAVRSIDITRGRATAVVDMGVSQLNVYVGSTVGKLRVEEILIDRVSFNDGKSVHIVSVTFPAAPSASGQQPTPSLQPFMNPPVASAMVPPGSPVMSPRVGGGAAAVAVPPAQPVQLR
jgi:hypothetical protein